jgi:protein-S-isoprenylcysteine O-methyltransferase Ste14
MLYANTVETVIFGLICGTWVIAELLGPVRWSRLSGGTKRERASMRVVVPCGLVGLGFCFLFPVLLPFARLPWPQSAFFAGLTITLVGIACRWYAIWTLGRYFTASLMIHPDQRVVQRGPYRLIRHPSYTGILLIALGLGLMLGNWISLLLLTTGLSAAVLFRIPREEQELLQYLGTEYQTYMQRTKRLIPFVY